MSDIVIRVNGLSKKYRIGGRRESYRTLRDSLTGAFLSPFRRARRLLSGQPYGAAELDKTIWALKGISFEIKRGEVVGIIGRNGAGKTTLLKILSRITEPTEGYAEIRGRVGSLLEVGTGFHPELTGRENIYLNGAILGMKKAEIARKFDEIVEFAEIDKFIDTPVKHYSSGMYVRLAFAVAAHLEPEILLVDEVLAVGDASFQKKCLKKMDDVAKKGQTVLFVSHNMQGVKGLCTKGILLEKGDLKEIGEVGRVVDSYLMADINSCDMERIWESQEVAPGNDRIRLRRIRLIPETGDRSKLITTSTPVKVQADYWNLVANTKLILNLALYTIDGCIAFVSMTTEESNWHGRGFPKGLFRSVCYIPAHLLNEGIYRIRLLFLDDDAIHLYDNEEAMIFTVHDINDRGIKWYGRWQGILRPKLQWTTDYVEHL